MHPWWFLIESPYNVRTYSNVVLLAHADAVTTEEGTGMAEHEKLDQKPLEMIFRSNLTYAERLMLKRARRNELGSAAAPASNGQLRIVMRSLIHS